MKTNIREADIFPDSLKLWVRRHLGELFFTGTDPSI